MKLITTLRVAALLVALPALSKAQITTVIQPPRAAASASGVAAGLRTDSAVSAAATSMRAWVDSVVGTGRLTPLPRDTTRDSVIAPVRTQQVADTQTTRVDVRDSAAISRNGVVAPATATDLPTLVLFGFAALGAGLTLRRRTRA